MGSHDTTISGMVLVPHRNLTATCSRRVPIAGLDVIVHRLVKDLASVFDDEAAITPYVRQRIYRSVVPTVSSVAIPHSSMARLTYHSPI